MEVESRTSAKLVFAPLRRSARLVNFCVGLGFILIGLLGLAVFPTDNLWTIAVAIAFPIAGLRQVFNSAPWRLEIGRNPTSSSLRWRSWARRRVELQDVDRVLIGIRRRRRGVRRFAVEFMSGTRRAEIFESSEYWSNDQDAIQQAKNPAGEIAIFLNCKLDVDLG